MATPSDMSSKATPGRKSVNSLTRLQNLATAALTMLREPPRIPKKAPPPELYLGDNSYALRLDEDVMGFDNADMLLHHLRELPEREIDIVFAGRTALDLSFVIPNGPFTDLRAMIETELEFRSPIQRDQAIWFWSAKETENGDWQIEAAIVLKASVDWVLDAVKQTGKSINLARRHNADGKLRVGAETDWLKKPSRLADVSGALGRLGRIPSVLRLPVAAFARFVVSVVALYVVQSIRFNDVADRAEAANVELRRAAAAQAITRGLQDRRQMGDARIAVIGTLAATLPDSVWLEQIIIDDTDITLIGFAPSAAEVTRLLSAMPSVTDIGFGSPVTRDNTQNLERFRINATLTGQLS